MGPSGALPRRRELPRREARAEPSGGAEVSLENRLIINQEIAQNERFFCFNAHIHVERCDTLIDSWYFYESKA